MVYTQIENASYVEQKHISQHVAGWSMASQRNTPAASGREMSAKGKENMGHKRAAWEFGARARNKRRGRHY